MRLFCMQYLLYDNIIFLTIIDQSDIFAIKALFFFRLNTQDLILIKI